MHIYYQDGKCVEAILLARVATGIRLALPGCDDALHLSQLNGQWITEELDPVTLVGYDEPESEPIGYDGGLISPQEMVVRRPTTWDASPAHRPEGTEVFWPDRQSAVPTRVM